MSILLIKKFLLGSVDSGGVGLWAGVEMLEKEREFKFTLQDKENIGIKEESSGELNSEGWQIIKEKWQGMEEADWKKMRAGRSQYIYKTFIKGGGTIMAKSKKNKKKVKNLFGLGKFEWNNEKTTMVEEKGVCAVIGKDDKGSLLVMMVKSVDSNNQKELWLGNEHSIKGGENGCKKFQENKGQLEKPIEVVRKGFIGGVGGMVFQQPFVDMFKQTMKGTYEAVFQGVVFGNSRGFEENNKGISSHEQTAWMEYGSVGIISGVKDAVVLDIIKFGGEREEKNWTRQKIFDIKKISMRAVTLVNLEDLVISEESIGDGKKNNVSWGNIPKPTLVSELLK